MIDPYATGVLQEEHHERLVADLEGFAKDAGILPQWIYTRLPKEISGAELEYLKNFRKLGGQPAGLCYVGEAKSVQIEQRMAAITGALVRNFIRARMMTLGTFVDASAGHVAADLSCVLIPNFFLTSIDAGMIAKWQLSAIYDTLVERQMHGKQTILYVKDLDLLGKEYGLGFQRLIEDFYLRVKV
ncbi:hypothetical protein [Hyphomicrobium sp. ghe19]|uniref:hypothetical protein n=1 Tax=Hyphomicrobium sp. ghe19 TaxID=2682968 RepID=UPI001366E29E|nr:hypothetical protein HYPP_02473 [Hyphomicrobium sp. ghe19]